MSGDLRTLAIVAALAALAACKREERRFAEPTWLNAGQTGTMVDGGAATAPHTAPGPEPYANNAWAMSQGSELYMQMNCAGCHGMGGGGSGPALMDGKWRYGSGPDDIFETIVNGRPNGMPAFRGRLSDQQVWQLVTYVRTLSGMARMDALPSRSDHMRGRPPPSMTDKQPLTQDKMP